MSFITEFKRRNVFKVGVAYAIVAWLLIQVADTLLPVFEAPDWVLRVFALVVILGFPLAILFAWAFELTPQGIRPTREVAPGESIAPRTGLTLNYVILGLVVLAVGFLLLDRYAIGPNPAPVTRVTGQESQGPSRAQRLSMLLPQEASIIFGWTPGHSLAISPDGQTVAFAGADVNDSANQGRLFLRELNSLALRELEGAEDPSQPFFSPDGQWIAFFSEGQELQKISLAGGRPVTLASDLGGALWGRGAWLDSQRIVFNHMSNPVLKSVSADGGEITALTELDPARGELYHLTGTAIPDANIILFTAVRQVENQQIRDIEALNPDTGERRLVLENAGEPQYLGSGHLIFVRDDVPMVAPFDRERLAITGPALPLRDQIRRDGSQSAGRVPQLAASRSGTLAFVPPINTLRQVYRVRRDGSSEALAIRPDRYSGITASPDGRYATLQTESLGERQIWLYDFERGTTTRLTQAESEASPAWHPQGRSLLISSTVGGTRALRLIGLDGSERTLMEFPANGNFLRNSSWHPDGRQLAVSRRSSRLDILLLNVQEDEETEVSAEPLIAGPTDDYSPRFSPDGRWLAYVSTRSGTWQVYVRRYPDGEELIASTGEQAYAPEWSPDGSELYFVQAGSSSENSDNLSMTAVTVNEVEGRLRVAQPIELFPIGIRNQQGQLESYTIRITGWPSYGVMPDGSFLMARGPSGLHQQEIVVVQNWLSELPMR